MRNVGLLKDRLDAIGGHIASVRMGLTEYDTINWRHTWGRRADRQRDPNAIPNIVRPILGQLASIGSIDKNLAEIFAQLKSEVSAYGNREKAKRAMGMQSRDGELVPLIVPPAERGDNVKVLLNNG